MQGLRQQKAAGNRAQDSGPGLCDDRIVRNMAISKRITTFEVPFGTQSTTYLEGEMEGQCEAITDYTDKS